MSKLIVGDVETNSINGGPLAGFRNAIINGNFDHWQRGTSLAVNGYGADRWRNTNIGSSFTQSRQAFTMGQTDVPNEPEYFSRTVVSSVSGAGNLANIGQYIEGVRTFAGQTATLSFYAKADAAKNIAVEFAQNFGTGGSPSAEVTGLGVTTCALTTAWQKFTVTVTLPSISGKTLGTNDNDFLTTNLWFDAGSNFNARTNSLGHQSGTFDIAQVQLEAGSVATPFERRPVGTELALCQRYYEITGEAVFRPNGAGNFYTYPVPFVVQKRVPPTATWIVGITNEATYSTSIVRNSLTSSSINHTRTSGSGDSAISGFITADSEL